MTQNIFCPAADKSAAVKCKRSKEVDLVLEHFLQRTSGKWAIMGMPTFYTQSFYTQLLYTQLFYTQLFYTQLFYTQSFYTQLFYTQLFYTQSFYTQLFYTQLWACQPFTHNTTSFTSKCVRRLYNHGNSTKLGILSRHLKTAWNLQQVKC